METKKSWKCFCGHLKRMKFRGVRCLICRCECSLDQPTKSVREYEMSDWLACDYKDVNLKSVIRLTIHTKNLVDELRA